jgi:acyl carrier protein
MYREEIYKLIVEILPTVPKNIEDDTLLKEYGLDSLNAIRLIVLIEDAFQLSFPSHMLKETYISNVSEIIKTIQILRRNEYEAAIK